MGAPLDDLRKELADVSARTTRFAITSLLIIALTSLTFGRALRAVDSRQVNELLDEIGAGMFSRDPTASHVKEIHDAIEKLSAAFNVDLPLSGIKLQLNLIYWAPLLPFLVLASLAYLAIAGSKQEALRTIARARIRAGDEVSPLDRLTFGVDTTPVYSSYPSQLGNILYVGVVICLGINVCAAFASAVTAEIGLIVVLIELARQLLIVSFYLLSFTLWVKRGILAEAFAIATGVTPEPRRKRFEKARVWLSSRARRWWRALTFGGSGLMISTLFLTTAATTTCAKGRTGMQLLRGRDGAVWPPVDDSFAEPIFRIDSLGRWVYIAAIVVAALAALIAIGTLMPKVARWLSRQWVWDSLRGAAVVILFFTICEFGFVWVAIVGPPALMPPAWELVYWLIPSLLYVWMTVIRKRKWIERWRIRVRPAIEVLYAPAWIVAPLALWGFSERIYGTPIFVVGSLCLASALVYAPLPIGVTEETAAPLGLAPSFHDQPA
jgi:hypothetical protein